MYKPYFLVLTSLFCGFLAQSASAEPISSPNAVSQGKTIQLKGVVVDEDNLPLPGATVQILKTQIHAVTDLDGNFVLNYPAGRDLKAVFKYIGMKDEIITLTRGNKPALPSGTNLTIRMKVESEVISEVVVTGYANISKKAFTGTATSVMKKDIIKASPKNAIEALQYFDPSFQIGENMDLGSNPNSLPDMTVRGQSGIGVTDLDKISSTSMNNNPNLPTFILDGFEVSASKIYDLDVNRIESMTLLKDAAATAMYGSRAANGVLVITTTPPKPGRVSVNYSLDLGLQTPDLSYYNLMDAEQKLEAEKIAGLYTSDDPSRQIDLDRIYNNKLQNIERGINTDWLRLPLQTGFSHKHSLSVEGGESSLRYRLDLMYDLDNGVMIGSSREKYSGGLSLAYNYKKISIQNYVSFDKAIGTESPYGVYSEFAKMNPYDTYLDANGNISKDMISWDSRNLRNPMFDATLASYDESNYMQFRDNFEVRWYILDDLNLRASASVFYDMDNKDIFRDPESTFFDSQQEKGDLRQTRRNAYGYDVNALLYYNGNIGKHLLNFSAGVNVKESISKTEMYHYVNFPEGGFTSPEFAEQLKYKPTTSTEIQRLFGTLAMLNYTYDNIYLLDVSGRLDGSSQFGSERKFAPFASAGAGLNIHNYQAVQNNMYWLDQFKLRGSFGQTGKVNFPSYTAQDKFFFDVDDWFTTGSAATLNYMGNPDLKWETTNTFDVGAEIGILKDLFYLRGNYYVKQTKDLIADMTIPTSSGFNVYKENVGEVNNRGWEVSLRAGVVRNRNTKLYLFANANQNDNELVKISNSMKAYNDRVNEQYENDSYVNELPMLKYYEGASLTAIYGMKSLGIDPATGKEMYQYKDGSVGYEWIGSENVVIGDTEPELVGSFGFNFFHKGFTVDAYFRYSYGGQIYNSTLLDKVERADPNYNCDIRVITDRWQKPGDVAAFKSLSDWKQPTLPTSRFVQDYNWLKLGSLSVGYELPQRVVKSLKLQRMRLQFNCNDLFTVSSIQIEKGTAYPFARSYNFVANVTF